MTIVFVFFVFTLPVRDLDLLERVRVDRVLPELPEYKALVDYFAAAELMRWPRVKQLYDAVDTACRFVCSSNNADVLLVDSYTEVFANVDGFGKDGKLWDVLQRRVVEVIQSTSCESRGN
jgi:hypothetical protein